MVSLLYWLLRRNGAKDLSHLNVEPQSQSSFSPGQEWELSCAMGPDAATPERQHLVPYDTLARMYGLTDRMARISTHPVNSLGNLTFISHQLNTFEGGGLGAKPIDWERGPAENRRAHMLGGPLGSTCDEEMKILFMRACDRDKEAFEAFVEKRQHFIAAAFCRWGIELREEARNDDLSARIEPQPRRLCESSYDQVRGAGFADCVEDGLIRLLRDGGAKGCLRMLRKDRWINVQFTPPHSPRRKKQPDLSFCVVPDGLPLHLWLRRWPEGHLSELAAAVVKELPGGTQGLAVGLPEVVSLPSSGPPADFTAGVLDRLWKLLTL